MKRSKIIKDLVNENIPISVALNNLFVFSKELGNTRLERWIKNELNGRLKVTNQPLSINCFGKYVKEIESLNVITNSILELFDKESSFSIDLTMMSGEVYKNSGIQCISITLVMGKNINNIVISNVKTLMLESLMLLETEFGVLDNLYLGEQLEDEKKVEAVNERVDSILFANGGLLNYEF